MTYVIGVDPGFKGALSVYDVNAKRIVSIIDMPVLNITINKKTRTRIDATTLFEYVEMQKAMGVELLLMEAVGGRPKQGASSAYAFGYGVGLLYMACVAVKMPIETVTPQVWKKMMRVPGKKDADGKQGKEYDGMIVSRADELLPDARHLFRGPQGGLKVDRAESAMLAKYAGDHALKLGARPSMAIDTEAYMVKLELGA
jgi:hypothetical protein